MGFASLISPVSTGDVAAANTDGGAPVKVGGVVSTTPPNITNGQRANLLLSTEGAITLAGDALGGDSINVGSLPGAFLRSTNNSPRPLAVLQYVYAGSVEGGDRLRTPFKFVPLAATAIGSEATIWTPASGKKFRLMGMVISASAAVSIILKDNTAGATIFQVPKLLVDTPILISLGNGIIAAAANNVLTATSSAAANLIGTIFGTEE